MKVFDSCFFWFKIIYFLSLEYEKTTFVNFYKDKKEIIYYK